MILKENRKRGIVTMLFIAAAMMVSFCATVLPSIASNHLPVQTETQQEELKAEFVRFSQMKIQKNQIKFHYYSNRISWANINPVFFPKILTPQIIPARGDLLYLHILKLF